MGAAVDEERWAGKTHLPASLVLVQSEQFEASKSVGCKWGIPRAVYLIFCVTLLFYYQDIKQEIVHALLFEEYGVSKKWVIIMDRRQDLNVTSTPAGK